MRINAESNSDQPKRDNPFQEEENQDNKHPRWAPGTELEYQGNIPEEKRAPGKEQGDDDTQDN